MEHVELKAGRRNKYEVLIEKHYKEKTLGRTRSKWYDNIKRILSNYVKVRCEFIWLRTGPTDRLLSRRH
jgi:hypothetical protein